MVSRAELLEQARRRYPDFLRAIVKGWSFTPPPAPSSQEEGVQSATGERRSHCVRPLPQKKGSGLKSTARTASPVRDSGGT